MTTISMKIIVTGGAGFIGSALVRHLIASTQHDVLVVDKLTYAGNLASLAAVQNHPRYRSAAPTSATARPSRELFAELRPGRRDASRRREPCRPLDRRAGRLRRDQRRRHLHAARGRARHWRTRPAPQTLPLPSRLDRRGLRLARRRRPAFMEATPYDPRSPYSASKAASDHLVRAWHHTYRPAGGRHQLLEQLRAVSVPREADPAHHPQVRWPASRCRSTATAPMCATGSMSRITRAALTRVLEQGRAGETYNIGGNAERRNIDVVTHDLRRPWTGSQPAHQRPRTAT